MIKKCNMSMSLIFVNIFRVTARSILSKFQEITLLNDQKDILSSNSARLEKHRML